MKDHIFHSEALRKGRISISGQPYLITTQTRDRHPLFLDYRLGRLVVNAMRYHAETGKVQSLAYVLMPDHLHWLISLQEGGSLSRLMASVKGFSARQIATAVRGKNAAPTSCCAVWQQGFHDHAVRTEENLRDVARYIVMNPVRAGLVSTVWQYPLWDAIWVDGS